MTLILVIRQHGVISIWTVVPRHCRTLRRPGHPVPAALRRSSSVDRTDLPQTPAVLPLPWCSSAGSDCLRWGYRAPPAHSGCRSWWSSPPASCLPSVRAAVTAPRRRMPRPADCRSRRRSGCSGSSSAVLAAAAPPPAQSWWPSLHKQNVQR